MEERGKIEGDLTVKGRYALYGMVTGDILVTAGAELELRGMCCGDMRVEPGGAAEINGMVQGNVLNFGSVRVDGMINGFVANSGSANFSRSEGSVIHGGVR